MKLSQIERLLLINQFKILERLYPDEYETCSNNRKALENGYELNYSWFLPSDDVMSDEECMEVIEILNMYRAIYFSSDNISDKELSQNYLLKFQGFDGNEEFKQYSYTMYLIIDHNRYKELKYGIEFPDFNSGSLMMPTYRKMVEFWRTHGKPQQMNQDFIINIIKFAENN